MESFIFKLSGALLRRIPARPAQSGQVRRARPLLKNKKYFFQPCGENYRFPYSPFRKSQDDLENPYSVYDMHLVFGVCPDASGKILDSEELISNIRLYLGLPQLLKLKDEPVIVDEGTTMEYQANRCRHHSGEVCDRHIAHAHSCQQSSS